MRERTTLIDILVRASVMMTHPMNRPRVQARVIMEQMGPDSRALEECAENELKMMRLAGLREVARLFIIKVAPLFITTIDTRLLFHPWE